MQPSGIFEERGLVARSWDARPAAPLLARFLGKFVLDIMPAAMASVIGGFLFTQYQFGHAALRPVAEQAAPASAEMMALVRDEHAMIVDYLKAQMAAEKSRIAAEDAQERDADAKTAAVDARVADAKPADAKPADAKAALEASARRIAVASARSGPPHAKAIPVAVADAAPHAPLVIAEAQLNTPSDDEAAPSRRMARDPNSLLGKTLDLKDHVVAATRHVVFMIGDMFASVGGRVSGAAPGGRQFSSES